MKLSRRLTRRLIGIGITLALGACVHFAHERGYTDKVAGMFAGPSSAQREAAPNGMLASSNASEITIASMNVKWLGYYPKRDVGDLTKMLARFDIVVIQELVAPPYPGTYPNGKRRKPDPEAAAFFDAMRGYGFDYVLSPSDTGPGKKLHVNSAQTEWFVAFYRPDRLCANGAHVSVAVCSVAPPAAGFIDNDLAANPVFARVPYAFGFSTPGGTNFSLVSVHLQPGDSRTESARRKKEIGTALSWADQTETASGHPVYVLGDTNLQDCGELRAALIANWVSLNAGCADTTPAPSDSPYDQVFMKSSDPLVDRHFGFKVIDLVDTMKLLWDDAAPYPGDPYSGNLFPQYYSDHDPVVFRLRVSTDVASN